MPLNATSKAIVIVASVSLSVPILVVILRCYVRLCVVKRFGNDDWFMGAALYGFIAQPAFIVTCILAKTSIAIALLRVTILRAEAWFLRIIIAISTAVGVLFFFVCIFQCQPVQKIWDLDLNGECLNRGVFVGIAYLYSVVAAITDLIIGLFPTFMFRSLQVDKRTKIGIIFVMGLGSIAGIVVIARIPYLPKYKQIHSLDSTAGIVILSAVETGIGISAGSMPALMPLFRRLYALSSPTLGRNYAPESIRLTGNMHFGRPRPPSPIGSHDSRQHIIRCVENGKVDTGPNLELP
ncbi:hypothetical protein BJY01DRAFT_255027 [Aspergillus pseudoustus]|uniref:Rhodopsin domain-containing protein n=1 Tax=Aspergillus pseudoustus TaxID=1810923 RepID=A0ABR4INK5_9EURO